MSRSTSKQVAAAGSGLPYLQNWVTLEARWYVRDELTLSQGGCEKVRYHPALGQVSCRHLCLPPHSPEYDESAITDSVLGQPARRLGESKVEQSGGW